MPERDRSSPALEATMLSQSGARPDGPERDLTGTRLCHFQVIRLLGRGGMGTVYLGHDTALDRPVAVKVLGQDITHDPAMVQRFEQEARAQARLTHPNVVQMYFIGEDHGVRFFAMEFVTGPALDTVLQGGARVPWAEALGYALSAARGLLQAAQAAGFIHRDVKPSNLLIDGKGGVKIFDFGLVKSLRGDSELTREGAIVGSPYYMAPEQGRAEAVDHRSDIYALGCTLYHLLCGRPPFEAPSPVGVISMHVTDRARPVRAHTPQAPASLERAVERMMAKAPVDRFGDYPELIRALEAAQPGVRSFSGFWARGFALAIDAALVGAVALFLGMWALPLAALYAVCMHALLGATLGKRVRRLTVLTVDDQRIGWRAAALRLLVASWGPLVATLILGVAYLRHRREQLVVDLSHLDHVHLVEPAIYVTLLVLTFVGYLAGFLVAAFHPKHQALHDLVAKTVVVERRD
jgi:uncharacterized RDD family membrane protein YckC